MALNYSSPSSWYSLQCPPGWVFEEEGQLTSFYKPKTGIGGLQVAAYRGSESTTAKDFLAYFLEESAPKELIETAIFDNGLDAASCHYEQDEMDHRAWAFRKECTVVFVTYVSDPSVPNRRRYVHVR